ncbi:MAG: CRISPR-associated endonuclease Cas2, partial [Solirubrobacteraceae bacterium]
VVRWLSALRAPVRACYEAGPTGFALYRAASVAGVGIEVVAPGKTPRPSGDRVKTDRKDAERLARLLVAGSLEPIAVPGEWVEAVRHLSRTREQVRRDLAAAPSVRLPCELPADARDPGPTPGGSARRRHRRVPTLDNSIDVAERTRYVVAYDIREPSRLRRVHQVAKDFGFPLQYSVFICDLTNLELLGLKRSLTREAKLTEDSIAILDLGRPDRRGIECIEVPRRAPQARGQQHGGCVVMRGLRWPRRCPSALVAKSACKAPAVGCAVRRRWRSGGFVLRSARQAAKTPCK